MAKCIVCEKDESEAYMIELVVNGENVKCCPLCAQKVEGNVTSMSYTKMLRPDPENRANKHIDIHYRVNPEYFANATYITLGFTYENDIPIESWQKIGKLQLTAIALGHPDDIDYVKEMAEKNDELTIAIFDSIEVITKEEYEKGE